MIDAILKGKLTREEENYEDLLTSCVFGAFKYSRNYKLLFNFLKNAMTIEGIKISDSLSSLTNINFNFWSWKKMEGCNGAEPDLLLKGDNESGEKTIILIEVKYHSDKSTFPDTSDTPHDQLAREYDNLFQLARNKSAKYYLIYLTSHILPPWNDIRKSIEEYESKREQKCDIYWLNWQTLTKILDNEGSILFQDIFRLLLKRGLDFFRGIKTIDDNEMNIWPTWLFKKRPLLFNWVRDLVLGEYKFQRNPQLFHWEPFSFNRNQYIFRKD